MIFIHCYKLYEIERFCSLAPAAISEPNPTSNSLLHYTQVAAQEARSFAQFLYNHIYACNLVTRDIRRLVSVYSKAFYTYMTAICQGAVGSFDNLTEHRDEISTLLRRPTQKVVDTPSGTHSIFIC